MGGPLQNTKIRLKDIPEQEASAQLENIQAAHPGPAVGEICIWGPSLFKGYFKSPDKGGLQDDGWLLTGDVGQLYQNGSIRILHRKADFIPRGDELESSLVEKPAGLYPHEYASAEKLEGIFI